MNRVIVHEHPLGIFIGIGWAFALYAIVAGLAAVVWWVL